MKVENIDLKFNMFRIFKSYAEQTYQYLADLQVNKTKNYIINAVWSFIIKIESVYCILEGLST